MAFAAGRGDAPGTRVGSDRRETYFVIPAPPLRSDSPHMRTLYLHIGDGKTGSTYLQHAFHLNAASLRAQGVDYPVPAGGLSKLGPGNAVGLFRSEAHLCAALEAMSGGTVDVLLSSETFMDYLCDADRIEGWLAAARRAGFGRVSVLVFLREPMGYLSSLYSQHLKGGENDAPGPFDEAWGLRVLAHYRRLAGLLAALAERPEVGLTVRNYGRDRQRLLPVSAGWLGLPPEVLRPPADVVVNRSLTRDEAALILAAKSQLSSPYPLLGFHLVDRLPDLRGENPIPDVDTQRAFEAMFRQEVEALNRFLEPRDRLVFGFLEPSPPQQEVSLSGLQLAAIGPELARHWDGEASLQAAVAGLSGHLAGSRPSPGSVEQFLQGQVKSAASMTGAIDRVEGRPVAGRTLAGPLEGTLQGWVALDPGRGLAGTAACLLIEDGHASVITVCRRVERPDVVQAFGQEGLLRCGFEAFLPPAPALRTGRLHLLGCQGHRLHRHEHLIWEII